MKKVAIIITIILSVIYAGGVGTTGANYLKIGLGAKATALGENFTALADDTSASYWNAAGLTSARTPEVDFMQLNWIAGISAKTFLGVYPITETDTVGAYLFLLDTPQEKETRYSSGSVASYEETGDKFNDEISVFGGSYAKKISKALSVGLGVKFINERLADEKTSGMALDVGMIYQDLFPQLTLGVNVQNIAIKKLRAAEDLPMSTTFGGMYTMDVAGNKLNILSDIKMPNDDVMRYGIGGEYWVGGIIAGRIGYNSFSKISMGLGVQMSNLVADYAYVPMGDLGVTHRFSVGYAFDTVVKASLAQPETEKVVVPVNPAELFAPSAPITETPKVEVTAAPVVIVNTPAAEITPAVEITPAAVVTPNGAPITTFDF